MPPHVESNIIVILSYYIIVFFVSISLWLKWATKWSKNTITGECWGQKDCCWSCWLKYHRGWGLWTEKSSWVGVVDRKIVVGGGCWQKSRRGWGLWAEKSSWMGVGTNQSHRGRGLGPTQIVAVLLPDHKEILYTSFASFCVIRNHTHKEISDAILLSESSLLGRRPTKTFLKAYTPTRKMQFSEKCDFGVGL